MTSLNSQENLLLSLLRLWQMKVSGREQQPLTDVHIILTDCWSFRPRTSARRRRKLSWKHIYWWCRAYLLLGVWHTDAALIFNVLTVLGDYVCETHTHTHAHCNAVLAVLLRVMAFKTVMIWFIFRLKYTDVRQWISSITDYDSFLFSFSFFFFFLSYVG